MHTILIWFARFFCFVALVVFHGQFQLRSPWLDFLFLDRIDGVVVEVTRSPVEQWHTERDRYEIALTYRFEVDGQSIGGKHRSYDLRDGFDRYAPGDTIGVYVADGGSPYARLSPDWKWSNLMSLGYGLLMLMPAMFLGVSFEPVRRLLQRLSGGDRFPWRWGPRTLGLFFILTAMSVRAEQIRALLIMDRAEATVLDCQRHVVRNNLAFTTVTYRYVIDGIPHEAGFRTADHDASIYSDHAIDQQIDIYVDDDDPRISVGHLDAGAIGLSLVLLFLGGVIILSSYPVGWRLIGAGIQWKLERR